MVDSVKAARVLNKICKYVWDNYMNDNSSDSCIDASSEDDNYVLTHEDPPPVYIHVSPKASVIQFNSYTKSMEIQLSKDGEESFFWEKNKPEVHCVRIIGKSNEPYPLKEDDISVLGNLKKFYECMDAFEELVKNVNMVFGKLDVKIAENIKILEKKRKEKYEYERNFEKELDNFVINTKK